MKRWIATIALSLILLPTVAFAQEVKGDSFHAEFLRSIDTIPTRASLDAAAPDARERLQAAALDESLTMYERHRAITLSSFYPDLETRRFLVELGGHDDVEIRRMAWYTLARAFGPVADGALVADLRGALADDSADVREWVVRGLRWVVHPDAREVLDEVAAGGDDELAKVARRALKRHAASVPVEESDAVR